MKAVVHLIDDDWGVLTALNRVLFAEGYDVRPSSNLDDFLAQYDPAVPACVVLDLTMPGMGGLELQSLLTHHQVGTPVIFLTGCGDISSSVKAMKAGAVDFLTKPVEADVLLSAIANAIGIDEASRSSRQVEADAKARVESLSPREREVFMRLLDGRINKQIAADMGIAVKTVKVHRAHIMSKLGVRSVATLVRLAQVAHVAEADAPLRAWSARLLS